MIIGAPLAMRRGDSSVSASTTSDQETFPNGCFVRPIQVSSNAQRRVRALVGTPEWHLERRNGYVRPPRRLPCGRECAVADFGECGDRKCGNYRLGDKTWNVRPTFLDFCVDHILQAIPPATLRTGVVYCSLGSGQLLFDWELLERLTLEEGVRLRAVHLIDQEGDGKMALGGCCNMEKALTFSWTATPWGPGSAWMSPRSGVRRCAQEAFASCSPTPQSALPLSRVPQQGANAVQKGSTC